MAWNVCLVLLASHVAIAGQHEWFLEQAVNSVTNYHCQSGMFSVGQFQSACQEVGGSAKAEVTCQNGAVVIYGATKTEVKMDTPLEVGGRLIIIATPTAATEWGLDLMAGNQLVMFAAAMFNSGGFVSTIMRNGQLANGNWVGNEITAASFPFTINEQFNTTLVVEPTQYKVYVDGAEIFDFALREPSYSVTKIVIGGDVTIKSVIRDEPY